MRKPTDVVCGMMAAAVVCALGVMAPAHGDAELPFGMRTGHLNLVFSVTDGEKVHDFYGEILGLKRIPDIDFPGDPYMIRYLGGESELKFIVTGQDLPKHKGGTRNARGIRLLALLLPAPEQAGIVKRLDAAGHDVTFRKGKSDAGYGYEYGMVYDDDGNQVELVFLDEDAPAEKFKQVQIGLTVSDADAMNAFLRDILGLPKVGEQAYGDTVIHRYGMGVSQIKFWEADVKPVWVGSPFEKIGMNLVQFLVPDVDAVRETVVARGGKIHTEPFPLGQLATIMFVEGPDGILFEFAGPLLPRFRE